MLRLLVGSAIIHILYRWDWEQDGKSICFSHIRCTAFRAWQVPGNWSNQAVTNLHMLRQLICLGKGKLTLNWWTFWHFRCWHGHIPIELGQYYRNGRQIFLILTLTYSNCECTCLIKAEAIRLRMRGRHISPAQPIFGEVIFISSVIVMQDFHLRSEEPLRCLFCKDIRE